MNNPEHVSETSMKFRRIGGSTQLVIESANDFRNAYELDPNVSTLRQILAIYEATGNTEAATAMTARIEEQIVKDNEAKKKRVSRSAAEFRKRLPLRRPQKPVAKTNAKPAVKTTEKPANSSAKKPSVRRSIGMRRKRI